MVFILKDSDSVWMVASAENTPIGVHTGDLHSEENLKMWRPLGTQDTIMASAATDRMTDVLRYADFAAFDAPLTQTSLIRNIIPTAKELLRDKKQLNGEHFWSEIAIAKGDKAFVVKSPGTVLNVDTFDVLGHSSSTEIIFGAAHLYRDRPPVERIAEIFRAVERTSRAGHFPIVIMNTKSKTREVIYK